MKKPKLIELQIKAFKQHSLNDKLNTKWKPFKEQSKKQKWRKILQIKLEKFVTEKI